MTPAVYEAVIEAAHARGLHVAAHIFYLEDAKALLRAGADMIAHSVRDTDIDDAFLTLMRARDVPYCPTLTRELSAFVYEPTPGFVGDPLFLREADPALVAQLQEPDRQAALRASPTAQQDKAGLTPMQVLRAATIDATRSPTSTTRERSRPSGSRATACPGASEPGRRPPARQRRGGSGRPTAAVRGRSTPA